MRDYLGHWRGAPGIEMNQIVPALERQGGRVPSMPNFATTLRHTCDRRRSWNAGPRIELGREGARADEISEYDGELVTLGAAWPSRLGVPECDAHAAFGAADRAIHQDSSKILGRHISEDARINIISAKRSAHADMPSSLSFTRPPRGIQTLIRDTRHQGSRCSERSQLLSAYCSRATVCLNHDPGRRVDEFMRTTA